MYITIPDAQLNRVLNAVANVRGYDTRKLTNENKAEFYIRMLIEVSKEWVKQDEGQKAQALAQKTVMESVDNELVIS